MASLVKVEDVPRPPKYSHKMPSKTGQSEYYRKFGQTGFNAHKDKGRSDSMPNRKGQSQQLSSTMVAPTSSNIVLPTATITPYESTYYVRTFANLDGLP